MPEVTEPIFPPREITPERKLEALQHVNKRSVNLDVLFEWVKIGFVSITLFVTLRTFVVEAF